MLNVVDVLSTKFRFLCLTQVPSPYFVSFIQSKFGFAQCHWCNDMNESFLKLGKMHAERIGRSTTLTLSVLLFPEKIPTRHSAHFDSNNKYRHQPNKLAGVIE